MKQLFLVISLSVAPCLAVADAQADAEYIAAQTLTKELFEGALAAQAPILHSAIENDLRKKGITLSNPERFFEILVEELIDEFTASMQRQTVPLYLDKFSPEELAAIARFYATDAGQALIQKTPELMIAGAELGRQAGMQAGQNVEERVAVRLEAEGIDLFDDPSLMQRLIDALRQ